MRFEDLAKEEGARVQEPEKVGAGETFINRAVGMLPAGNRVVDAVTAAGLTGARAVGRLAPGLSRSMASLPLVGQLAPVADSGVKLTPQAQAELERMGTPEEKPAPEPGLVDTYRQVRDTRAERTEVGSKQNPWAGRAGALTGFALSLLAPLPKVGTGLKGAVATGAGYGALQGLTEGKADLTRGEVGQAVEDTLTGGVVGGAMGAAGYGLQKLGERGVRALRNAREDTLAQETLKAQEEAAAAGAEAAKAGEAERKMVGQAREMNKRVDARAAAKAAREAARAAREEGRAQKLLERARQREAPPEDPSTKVLEGYAGKAGERKAVNYDRVRQYREDIHSPDMDTKASSDLQNYIDQYGHAVDDPGRFRREFIQRYLRENHGDEVAERLMRERVGPGGEILPRPNAAPPAPTPQAEVLAPPPTRKPGNMAYDVGGQRGPEFSKQVTAGGPGPSLAEEAEAAMAARRAAAAGANVGRGTALPAGQLHQELLPPLERAPVPAGPRPVDAPWVPNAPRVAPEPVLSAPPARRPGAAPMSLDVGGRPGPLNMEPTPSTPRPVGPVEHSMVAPVDAPLPPAPATRVADVMDLRRPVPLPAPAPPPAGVPTLHGGEGAMPPVGPTGQAPPINEVQDVTRLAGPADIGPLAAERAAQREQHAMGALVRGGYDGVRSGNNVVGAVLGGLAGLRREALRDPAVKARVLSAAKVHLLAGVSPEVFARVGAPLAQAATSGDGRYQTMRYVYARKDPEFRKAEAEAAAKASHLTDEQLMDLISGAAPQ